MKARIRVLGGVAAMALLNTACAHERPAVSSLQPSGARFAYFAPSAKVSLAGEFELKKCTDTRLLVVSTLAAVSTGTANPEVSFELDGAYLASARQKRELAIELHDNRTLKSVNASSSDRTGAIVTNVLKTVGTIGGALFGLGASPNPPMCNDVTLKALRVADELRSRIDVQRDALLTASPEAAVEIGEQIDVLAAQLSALTKSLLTISVSRPVPLGDNAGSGTIRWTMSDLAKWLAVPGQTVCIPVRPSAFTASTTSPANACASETDLLRIGYSVTASPAPVNERLARSPCRGPNPAAECGKTLVLAAPVRATIKFTTETDNIIGHPVGGVLESAVVPVPQWGRAEYLPLDVRTFRSRTIGFTFDQFGQRQTFKWSSDATLENATAAIQSAAEAGAATVKNLQGPSDTAHWKEQIEELETRMKLNKLKLCQGAIEGGATKCEE